LLENISSESSSTEKNVLSSVKQEKSLIFHTPTQILPTGNTEKLLLLQIFLSYL